MSSVLFSLFSFRVNDTVERYEHTRLLAEKSYNLSTATYGKSLAIYTEADSLLIHDFNSEELKQQTDELNRTVSKSILLSSSVDDVSLDGLYVNGFICLAYSLLS